MLVKVKVVPGASRTRIAGTWQDRLKIAVAAPPEKGRANDALCRHLAKLLRIRKQDVTIVAGEMNPQKTIRIDRSTIAAVREMLSARKGAGATRG